MTKYSKGNYMGADTMADYSKQVAEAVRNACQHTATDCAEKIDASDQYGKDRLTGAYLAASSIAPIDLDPIITSVPMPEPVAYVSDICMNWLKLKAESLHAKIYFEGHSYPFCEDTVPLYTYPPDAQAEIDRMNSRIKDLETASAVLGLTPEEAKAGRERHESRESEIERLTETIRQLREDYAMCSEAGAKYKSEAAKREAFIDELVKQRHTELMIAATRGWVLPTDDTAESIAAVVAKIEQEREE